MLKKEIIWREILFQALEKKKTGFTQKELAEKYGFSLSTVFNALKIPRQIGALEGQRGFRVQDVEKFLYLWATFRKINRETVYQTSVSKSVLEIEGEMPPTIIFGAYSAFRLKYKTAPADYDKVYVYADKKRLAEIKNRFPEQKGYKNLVVLSADRWLKDSGQATPDCQTFVDLWNLPEWYAKDFLNALKEKILL